MTRTPDEGFKEFKESEFERVEPEIIEDEGDRAVDVLIRKASLLSFRYDGSKVLPSQSYCHGERIYANRV